MKKIKRLLTVVVALGLLVGLSGFAFVNDPAVVTVSEDGCYIGNIEVPYHSVSNHAGNNTLICKGKKIFPAGNPSVTTGFLCGTTTGLTTNSSLVISASGNATLRCQIKGND